MALLRSRGKLFAGALFAGALFGAQEIPVNTGPQNGGVGGSLSYHPERYKPKFYELKKRDATQLLEVRNIEQEEEEIVVLFVITELYRRGLLS